MWGRAAVDRLQIERLAEDNREACVRPQVGAPVPRHEARHGDHHILTIEGDRLQKRRWTRLHIAVPDALAVLVEDTDRHGAGMASKATGNLRLVGGESPEVSSCFARGGLLLPADHCGMLRRGPPYVSRACSRRLTGYAPASLPLPTAPDAQRSASFSEVVMLASL
jgi:hypothetical protein